jgi:hypothetical protein
MEQFNTILFRYGHKAILILFTTNIEHILHIFCSWALLSCSSFFVSFNLYPGTSYFLRVIDLADYIVVYDDFLLFYFSMLVVHINKFVSTVHPLYSLLIKLVVL